MIDPDLIEKNSLAKEGLKMLAQSGILKEQQARLAERVSFGDADESDENILKVVRAFRRIANQLESLQKFGEELIAQEGVKR